MEFKVWLESRLLMKQKLMRDFVSSLGYNKDALDNQDLDFNTIPPTKVKAAIQQLQVDDNYKQKLQGLLKTDSKGHFVGSVRTFVNQIDPLYIKEKQDKAFTYPATIPQGQRPAPHPVNPQQQAQMQPP